MIEVADAVQGLVQREDGHREHGKRRRHHTESQLTADDRNDPETHRECEHRNVHQDRERIAAQMQRKPDLHEHRHGEVVRPRPDDDAAFGHVHLRIELVERARIGHRVEDSTGVIERIGPERHVVPVRVRRGQLRKHDDEAQRACHQPGDEHADFGFHFLATAAAGAGAADQTSP